jgi:hypothetical protein
MKPKDRLPHRKASRARRRNGGVPLDAIALEAIERFVRVLARCGGAPGDILRAFSRACRRIPKHLSQREGRAQRELSDASHILTMWFSDPLYLDREGAPIRLLFQGAAPSLHALIRRIDPSLKAEEVLRYLLRTKAVQRIGSRYAPRSRVLSLRGSQGPDSFRNLRSLVGILRTLEHNMKPKSEVPSWFEYFAENPRFPVSARGAFDKHLDELGMEFLHALDTEMHRRELRRQPGERTVRMGVGIYRFEDDELDLQAGEKITVARKSPRSTRKERRSA